MVDATRVALLARPGEACERLRAALREAGGKIVLEADPSTLAADVLLAAAPQTVLVALDPTVEDALDRFDAVLGDPGVAVIFDEADLAARREGWDAARWVRHLSAKLHGHRDVLPPGREPDERGAAQSPPLAPAAVHGGDVREISIPAPATGTHPGAFEASSLEARTSDASPPEARTTDELSFDAASFEVIEGLPGLALEAMPDITLDLAPHVAGTQASDDIDLSVADVPFGFAGLELTDDIDAMSLEGEAPSRNFDGALEFDAVLAGMGSDGDVESDASRGMDERPALAGHMADLAARLPHDENIAQAVADDTFDPPQSVSPPPSVASKPTFDFGALSLVEQDDASSPAAATAHGASGRFQHDLGDLERRIAVMALSDGPDVQQTTGDMAATPVAAQPVEAAPGAVLILAGIGGPDAVRQILAGLPAGFRRPVLISQRLDGGRYDRLVQQMGRAASLPVQLAQAGTRVDAGQIYIVPPELGLDTGDGLRFSSATPLLPSLPADESAVLLLSGADPAQVEDALAKASQGALVAGQSPEGCYDAAAPIALTTRGGIAGTPPELVQRLLQRWPV